MPDVLVIDDHQLVRETVARAIRSEWPDGRVDEVGDAEGFFVALSGHDYDLVVLDIELGEHGGLELLATLRRDHPDVRVVILTMHDGDHFLRRALALEAEAFVSKAEPLESLLVAIRTVADGQTYLSPDLMRRAVALATGRSPTIEAGLTERELEVLRLLADGARPAEIAAGLYLSVKTVKNHLTRIYAKLGVETAAQAVSEAFRRDIVTMK
ncbi:MAG TPA: response regulator transcription factor [Nitriliruptorales bacterium]